VASDTPPGRLIFAAAVAYVTVTLALFFWHEPWRDEAQVWLIARDAVGLGDLYNALGYERTPGLWLLLVLPLARLGFPYASMNLMHSVLAAITGVFFVYIAPFSRLQRVMFVFGYFMVYEYNAIARSYVLSVLLMFLLAWSYKDRFKAPMRYSLLVALLANTNAHSIVLACVFAFSFLVESLPRVESGRRIAFGVLVALVGVLVASAQIMEPPDLIGWYRGFWVAGSAGRTLTTLNGAFIPVPKNTIQFWNSLAFETPYAFIIFLLTLMPLARNRKALSLYILGSLLLIAVFAFKSEGGLRHQGLIYMYFIACMWIAYGEGLRPRVFEGMFLSLVLIIQLIGSPIAVYYEAAYDFSAGKEAAGFISSERQLAGAKIATYRSYVGSAMLPYLAPQRMRFYCIEYSRECSYMVWNRRYYDSLGLDFKDVVRKARNEYDADYLIVGKNATVPDRLPRGCTKEAEFWNTIQDDESIGVYRLK